MLRSLTGARRTVALALLLGTPLLACGGGYSSNGPAKTTIVFGGVFAGENGTEAGSFTASVVVEDSAGTGTFHVNGSSKTFSSISYDGTSIVATGPGFVFTGTATDSSITGSYTSATGGGLFTGLRKTGSSTPAAYCGTHIGTRGGAPVAGPFAFVQQGTTRFGVFTSVLGDGFRGAVHGSGGLGPVVLDTLTGTAAVAVASGSFSGDYLMASGDSGAIAGGTCPATVVSPIGSVLQGVLGSFDGTELGDFSFNLSSTGVGSTGTYKVGGVAKNFLAVISGVQNQVAGFDSSFSVIANLATDTVEGTYANQGAGSIGKIAGLNLHGGSATSWCGTQTGGGSAGGVFSFIMKPDSTIFGLFTGGNSTDSFQGLVTGKAGNDSSVHGRTGQSGHRPAVGWQLRRRVLPAGRRERNCVGWPLSLSAMSYLGWRPWSGGLLLLFGVCATPRPPRRWTRRRSCAGLLRCCRSRSR